MARKKTVREAAPAYVTQPMSEVFWLAFQSLSKRDRQAVVGRLLEDPEFSEDLRDICMILDRRDEPSRPFEEFVDELRREGRL